MNNIKYIPWYMYIILYFVEKQYSIDVYEGHKYTLVYKAFRGIIYIIDEKEEKLK